MRNRYTMSQSVEGYEPGRQLKVKYVATGGEESILDLEILEAYHPFSLSIVCKVQIISSSSPLLTGNLPSTCIMKLFDRRYLINLREDYDKARPYSAAKEAAHQALLLKPRKKERRSLYRIGEEEDDGAFEAALDKNADDMFIKETRAHAEMREVQGSLIPKLYGTLHYESPYPPPSNDNADPMPDYRYTASGILLEYIPSRTLKQYIREAMRTDPVPYETIAEVCNHAVGLVDRLDEFDVLNLDVRMENVLVAATDNPSPNPSRSMNLPPSRFHRCLAIDFAGSRLRFLDESDELWRRAKDITDQVGAVGCVAAGYIRNTVNKIEKEGGQKFDREALWTYNYHNLRWHRVLEGEEYEAYYRGDWPLYEEKGGETDEDEEKELKDDMSELGAKAEAPKAVGI